MRRARRGRGPASKSPPFVSLTWMMLNSDAFKKLPPSAAKALPYFLGKVKRIWNHPSRYIDEFTFSYREGNNLGFAFATFSKVIQSLVHYGFIDPVDKGGLRSDGKSLNVFTLSKRWESFGREDFQNIEWRCFSPREN